MSDNFLFIYLFKHILLCTSHNKDKYCRTWSANRTDWKTKVGKSITDKTIVGLLTRLSQCHRATNIQCSDTERFGTRLVIVNTLGQFHSNLTDEEIYQEICRWPSLESPVLRAILLEVQAERFTKEDEKSWFFQKHIWRKFCRLCYFYI